MFNKGLFVWFLAQYYVMTLKHIIHSHSMSSKICRSKPKWQSCLSKLVLISRLLLLKQLVRVRFSVGLGGILSYIRYIDIFFKRYGMKHYH